MRLSEEFACFDIFTFKVGEVIDGLFISAEGHGADAAHKVGGVQSSGVLGGRYVGGKTSWKSQTFPK